MTTLAREWASFRERVVPANAHPIQVQESQRAFYAGAASMFKALQELSGPSTEVTEAEVQSVEELHQELLAFGRDVEAGRA